MNHTYPIDAICVFCGSSPGNNPEYIKASEQLADCLLERDITLVYGGAHVGVMGAIANRLMAGGGKVIGVIPQALVDIEVAHDGLSELRIVADMHERKANMAALSDAFVALPGGLGTLEEMFEVLTWAQLGFHHKPCGLMNVDGFYNRLLTFLDHASAEGFMKPAHRDLLLAETAPEQLLRRLENYLPTDETKLRI